MSERDIRRIFARNLNGMLHANDITQKDLAEKLGLSESAVSSWVRGEKMPRMGTVDNIAEIFNCPRSELINEMPPEHYYYSAETREIAEEISKDETLKLLFKAARDVESEDLKAVHTLLKSLKKKERHEE